MLVTVVNCWHHLVLPALQEQHRLISSSQAIFQGSWTIDPHTHNLFGVLGVQDLRLSVKQLLRSFLLQRSGADEKLFQHTFLAHKSSPLSFYCNVNDPDSGLVLQEGASWDAPVLPTLQIKRLLKDSQHSSCTFFFFFVICLVHMLIFPQAKKRLKKVVNLFFYSACRGKR